MIDPAPPLTRRFKAAFAVGSTAEAMLVAATTQFTLIFYNQVSGVPAQLVGLALAFGLMLNAVFDPMVGSWSDRTRSPLGRRHPFMIAAIVPIAITFYALFHPPAALDVVGKAVWLAIASILFQQSLTLFHTPHLAFGGELSSSYTERSNVMSYNTFFLWLGDTGCWLLSFGWFFRSAPGVPNGALEPSRWPPLILAIVTLAPVLMLASTLLTLKRIRFVPQASATTAPFGAREFMRDVARALSNRNYLALLIGYFFLALMSGVRNGLWLYCATFVWRLSSAQISLFVIGSAVSYLVGSAIVVPLHRRFDKRWSAVAAVLLYTIGPAMPLLLWEGGLLSAATPGVVWILVAFSVLQHLPYSILNTTVFSALADIADENELRYGIRQEGILYSTRTFFLRVDQALGAALAGWALSFIAFPSKAVPGEVAVSTIDELVLVFVFTTVPGIIATVFYSRICVTLASYSATAKALNARRRLEAAGNAS